MLGDFDKTWIPTVTQFQNATPNLQLPGAARIATLSVIDGELKHLHEEISAYNAGHSLPGALAIHRRLESLKHALGRAMAYPAAAHLEDRIDSPQVVGFRMAVGSEIVERQRAAQAVPRTYQKERLQPDPPSGSQTSELPVSRTYQKERLQPGGPSGLQGDGQPVSQEYGQALPQQYGERWPVSARPLSYASMPPRYSSLSNLPQTPAITPMLQPAHPDSGAFPLDNYNARSHSGPVSGATTQTNPVAGGPSSPIIPITIDDMLEFTQHYGARGPWTRTSAAAQQFPSTSQPLGFAPNAPSTRSPADFNLQQQSSTPTSDRSSDRESIDRILNYYFHADEGSPRQSNIGSPQAQGDSDDDFYQPIGSQLDHPVEYTGAQMAAPAQDTQRSQPLPTSTDPAESAAQSQNSRQRFERSSPAPADSSISSQSPFTSPTPWSSQSRPSSTQGARDGSGDRSPPIRSAKKQKR